MADKNRSRYFQVGFNRCGTTSIAELLNDNGINTVHHVYCENNKKCNIAKKIVKNISEGRLPLHDMDHIDAFTDVEYVSESQVIEGNRFYREIAIAHPDVKFILNIREKEDWLASRLEFGDYVDRYAKFFDLSKIEVIEKWSRDWDTHIEVVKEVVPANRLLIINIDAPDAAAMQRFFGLGKNTNLRIRNKTASGVLAQRAREILPVWFVRLVPNSVKNYLKQF